MVKMTPTFSDIFVFERMKKKMIVSSHKLIERGQEKMQKKIIQRNLQSTKSTKNIQSFFSTINTFTSIQMSSINLTSSTKTNNIAAGIHTNNQTLFISISVYNQPKFVFRCTLRK